jgi:hypothetical protein
MKMAYLIALLVSFALVSGEELAFEDELTDQQLVDYLKEAIQMDKQTLLIVLRSDIYALRQMQTKYVVDFADAHDVWMDTIGPMYHQGLDRALV